MILRRNLSIEDFVANSCVHNSETVALCPSSIARDGTAGRIGSQREIRNERGRASSTTIRATDCRTGVCVTTGDSFVENGPWFITEVVLYLG